MTRGQVGLLGLTCTTLSFAASRRLIPAHSISVQFSVQVLGHLLDRFAVRRLHDMRVDAERCACICMPELSLRRLDGCAGVYEQGCVHVPEGMEARTRDPEPV